jgi:hypothetical protein
MLTAIERTEIHSLLTRFNDTVEGETVVANLLRSLEAGIVDKSLAKIVLNAWCDSVKRADDGSPTGQISPEHALQITESGLLTTVGPCPFWDKIRTYDPFKPAPPGIGEVSNIKNLSTVLKYLFGITDLPDPHTGDPIPLSHHGSITPRRRQLDRISRSMAQLKTHPLIKDARIHHKKWFWVTPRHGLEDVLRGCTDSEAATTAVDKLGLVHFSRKLTNQSAADRYIVEVRLSPSFASEYVKPSFIFSDHNPRFAAWTDTIACSDPHWGRAADLNVFHNDKRLAQGCKEMVRATPDNLLRTDILDFSVLGYLDVNRWGMEDDNAKDTDAFAACLREMQPKEVVVDRILDFFTR